MCSARHRSRPDERGGGPLSETGASDQIHNLWPTAYGQADLPEHADHQARLLALAGATQGNLFDNPDPAVQWLRAQVDGALAVWFAEAGCVRPPGLRVVARFVLLGMGDYREPANEPGAGLGGVYLVRAPAPSEVTGSGRDQVPSQLTLLDPRVGFNAISVAGDPYFSPAVNVPSRAGLLALWPGYLRQFFSVHLASEPWAVIRMRVEFDDRSGAMSAPVPATPPAVVPLRVSRLFATKLVERHLPDCHNPNLGLKTLIRREETRQADYTARYQEQDFFSRGERPVKWLLGHINESVAAYLEHVGVQVEVDWTPVEGWYNVNRFGDHHAPHVHQACYLSGTYYLQMPGERDPALPVRADATPAAISFYDPRTAANMLALPGEADSRPVHRVTPSPGTLMMWPSALQHYVHPNLSRDERISISFNIILRRVNGVPQ